MSFSCEGKIRFATFAAASRAAKRGRRRNDRAVNAYACRECHGFHVGGNRHTSSRGKESPSDRPFGREMDDFEGQN